MIFSGRWWPRTRGSAGSMASAAAAKGRRLQHAGGSFNIEFRADGYNHFICNDFPAHSHWRLDNSESPTPTVYINWGKYGEYELVISADGTSMAGSAKGQPDNWRKAVFVRKLGAVEEAHVHDY